MIDILTGFADTIMMLVDFVIKNVTDWIKLFGMLANFVRKIPFLFFWLPAPVLNILVMTFGIVVFYKILGREG